MCDVVIDNLASTGVLARSKFIMICRFFQTFIEFPLSRDTVPSIIILYRERRAI